MRLVLLLSVFAIISCGKDERVGVPSVVNQCERYDEDAYQCILADRVCYIYNLRPRHERVVCRLNRP